jgi:hypothetical protein
MRGPGKFPWPRSANAKEMGASDLVGRAESQTRRPGRPTGAQNPFRFIVLVKNENDEPFGLV